MLARGRQSGMLFLADFAFVVAAPPISAFLRLGPDAELLRAPFFLLAIVLLNAATFLSAFHYFELYELKTLANENVLAARVVRSVAAATMVVAILYYALPSLHVGRGILFIDVVLVALWVYGIRVLLKLASQQALHERIVIVGAGDAAIEVGREILTRKKLGYHLVGFLDKTPEKVGVSILNPTVLGTYDKLVDVCRRERIDRVLVCVKDRREGNLPTRELLYARVSGIEVEDGASFSERLTGKIPVRDITPSWFIFGPGFRQPHVTLLVKRALDLVVATIGILLTAPAMLLTALAIKLDSPGPVFFEQERVGLRGKTFTLFKFRSMRTDAEKDGPKWATENDDRVTRVGRVIRKTRLDELPQFWNVLIGDMSLVGPRPERPVFVELLTQNVPFYDMRHVVRPGVTGWAQVKYRYGASEEDSLQKLQYDLYYIKHLSVWRDLLVMFDTAKVMLLGEGAH